MKRVRFTAEHRHVSSALTVTYPAGYEGDVPPEVAEEARKRKTGHIVRKGRR